MNNEISHIGPNSNSDTNLDITERLISAAVGGALLYSTFSGPSRLLRLGLASFLFYRAASGSCAFYKMLGRHAVPHPRNVNIRCVVVVNRSRPEVYSFWRKLENLPRFMKHLVRVEEHDALKSTWEASIPGLPLSVSWQATIVKEQENELLGWESLANTHIVNAGKVEFVDAGIGRTEVRIVITYRAPAGLAGEKIALWLNPSFEKIVLEDLRRFKEVIESPDELGVD